MPALTELQMAVWSASLLLLLQVALDAVTAPAPPRLRLATLMPLAAALAMTQSTPQMTDDHEPWPVESSTLTAIKEACGATPTTPKLLSRAATVPATCVPWPLSSSAGWRGF